MWMSLQIIRLLIFLASNLPSGNNYANIKSKELLLYDFGNRVFNTLLARSGAIESTSPLRVGRMYMRNDRIRGSEFGVGDVDLIPIFQGDQKGYELKDDSDVHVALTLRRLIFNDVNNSLSELDFGFDKLRATTSLSDNKQFVSLDIAGTTAERPQVQHLHVGVQYFDTTLNKPIWWNGTNWVDATGTSV